VFVASIDELPVAAPVHDKVLPAPIGSRLLSSTTVMENDGTACVVQSTANGDVQPLVVVASAVARANRRYREPNI